VNGKRRTDNGKRTGDFELAARLCLAYSDYKGNEKTMVRVGENKEILVRPVAKSEAKALRV
jgi:hypothetical protein